MANRISRNIEDKENIVRGIFHPYHIKSNGSIKREAFIPPKNRNDVSVMRLDFASSDICKLHLKAIETPNKKFRGIAEFTAAAVRHVNRERTGSVEVSLKASPLDENRQERKPDEEILDTDLGNPFHADLLYSQALTDEAEPKTEIRILADALRKQIIHFEDINDTEV